MFLITIDPEDYKYLRDACEYCHADLLPPRGNSSDYLVCPIQCVDVQLFYVGRVFEKMKAEAENSNDEVEE